MKNDLEKALEYGLDAGCSDVELYISGGRELSLELRNGALEKYQDSKSNGVGIRTVIGNRQGLVYGTGTSFEELKRAIDEAMEIVSYMDEDEAIVLHGDDHFEGDLEPEERRKIEELPLEEKLDYLKKIEAQGNDALIESATYDETSYSRRILNTRGLDKTESGSYCGSAISLAIDHDGASETGYSYHYTRKIDDLLKRDLGLEAFRKAKEMLGATIIPTGRYMVVFNNEVVVDLLGLLAYSFNGENIYKGKSLFKDKQNTKVISGKISIFDDGTMDGALGRGFFDGDGINLRKNTLIDKGVFKGGLYNLSIARKAGFETTGNCSRSYSSLPSIGYHNLYLEKGEVSQEEMFQSIGNGLIIKELMGLHMANPITGEFSLGASGLVVKNGKPDKGFRGVTVSGNLTDLFSQVEAVGSDFSFRTTVGAPSLLIKDVMISGS